jgi:addiction module HigA family antidote
MAKKLKPIHPGEQLREEFMGPLELSSNALARALGVTPARINEIVRAGAASARTRRCASRASSVPRISSG